MHGSNSDCRELMGRGALCMALPLGYLLLQLATATECVCAKCQRRPDLASTCPQLVCDNGYTTNATGDNVEWTTGGASTMIPMVRRRRTPVPPIKYLSPAKRCPLPPPGAVPSAFQVTHGCPPHARPQHFAAQIGVSSMLICQVTLTITDSYALSNSSSLNFTVRLPPSVFKQPVVLSPCTRSCCLLHTRQQCRVDAVAAGSGSTAGPSPKPTPTALCFRGRRPFQVTPSAPCAVVNANSTITTGDTFYANALDTVCNGDTCDYSWTVGAGGRAAAHRTFCIAGRSQNAGPCTLVGPQNRCPVKPQS